MRKLSYGAGLDESILDRQNATILDCIFAVEYLFGHMRTLIKFGIGILAVVSAAMFFLWYSMTWSERFLGLVQTGMSERQVQQLVGAPLRVVTRTNDTVAWYYDRWWSSDAVVYFDTNRVVSAIETD